LTIPQVGLILLKRYISNAKNMEYRAWMLQFLEVTSALRKESLLSCAVEIKKPGKELLLLWKNTAKKFNIMEDQEKVSILNV